MSSEDDREDWLGYLFRGARSEGARGGGSLVPLKAKDVWHPYAEQYGFIRFLPKKKVCFYLNICRIYRIYLYLFTTYLSIYLI